jgi:NAD(P)-dependent dehydrogenase (short-subunit alcohol dehydrogenase family)
VLTNNAVAMDGLPQQPPRLTSWPGTAVETNLIGVIRVTNAMRPPLRRSASPRIVNMSSTVGAPARQAGECPELAAGHSVRRVRAVETMLDAVTVE